MLPAYATVALLLACRSQSAATSTDTRTPIALPADAAEAVRSEMRTMLGSLHTLLASVPTGDTATMRRAARASGMSAAADTALEHLLPETFFTIGTGTHMQFDSLATALAAGLPRDSVIGRLGRLTSNCVSCHATYRLVPAGAR